MSKTKKLGKDYVKNEIIKRLSYQTPEQISQVLNIDVLIITSIQFVEEYGEPFGDILTGYDIEKLYTAGLTFSEIAYLRGITKEGIRLMFDRFVGSSKQQIKKKHYVVREKIRDAILEENVRLAVITKGKKGAYKELGYSRRYFNALYNKIEKEREIR